MYLIIVALEQIAQDSERQSRGFTVKVPTDETTAYLMMRICCQTASNEKASLLGPTLPFLYTFYDKWNRNYYSGFLGNKFTFI